MNSNLLYEKFQNLCKNPHIGDGYDVTNVDGTYHKLGISQEKYPIFFISTNDSQSPIRDLSLENLDVRYCLSCRLINDSGETETNRYSMITLRSHDASLHMQFIDIVLLIIGKLAPLPSKHDIAKEVEGLVSIFEAFKRPPKKKIQGLWAELLVIEQSSNPELLISAWHADNSAKYDFTMGRDKLEIKSTSSEQRIHKITLDQLNPSENSRLLIASTIVRESGHSNEGLSIDELRDKILEKVTNTEAKLRLCRIIADTIGTEVDNLKRMFFDYVGASDSLKFYDYKKVPKIEKETVERGVSKVSFDSDFSGIPDILNGGASFSLDDSPLFLSLIVK